MAEAHDFGVDPAAVEVARTWIEALLDARLGEVWPKTDETYRLALTQWWMSANPGVQDDPAAGQGGRDDIARRICTGTHPFSEHLLRVVNRDLGEMISDFAGHELLVGTAGRPLAPDLEAVALFIADDLPDGVFAPGASARAVTIPVRTEVPNGSWPGSITPRFQGGRPSSNQSPPRWSDRRRTRRAEVGAPTLGPVTPTGGRYVSWLRTLGSPCAPVRARLVRKGCPSWTARRRTPGPSCARSANRTR